MPDGTSSPPPQPVSISVGGLIGAGAEAGMNAAEHIRRWTPDDTVKILLVIVVIFLGALLGWKEYQDKTNQMSPADQMAFVMRAVEDAAEKSRQLGVNEKDKVQKHADDREDRIRTANATEKAILLQFFATESEKNRKVVEDLSAAVKGLSKVSIVDRTERDNPQP